MILYILFDNSINNSIQFNNFYCPLVNKTKIIPMIIVTLICKIHWSLPNYQINMINIPSFNNLSDPCLTKGPYPIEQKK